MLDLKKIRQCPEDLVQMLEKRGLSKEVAYSFIDIDKRYREAQKNLQDLQAQTNAHSKNNSQNDQNAQDIKKQRQDYEKECKDLKSIWEEKYFQIPNFLLPEVPEGHNEEANQVCSVWGEPHVYPWQKDHVQLGQNLQGMDFVQAAKVSGARFVYLLGDIARLERALGQWMMDQNTQAGYQEVAPPYLVRAHAAFGAGQLPKFQEDLFQTTQGNYLISTSEVPLVNWAADKIFKEEDLPLRLTALTPCFRSEAGASGKDTHGMMRQHQFHKAELVVICGAEDAQTWHEKMVGHSQSLLEALHLPYRKMLLCAGDTGAASQKTYDLEVWIPSQKCYREIASCSQCGTYQSRRLAIKGENKVYLDTLNGSSLPTGRTLIALLENHQREDGTIAIPEVLWPYMKGTKTLDGKIKR